MDKKLQTPSSIFDIIIEMIYQKAKNGPDKIQKSDILPESNLSGDLGLDSLDQVELVNEVEKEFGIVVSNKEAEKIVKVKDIFDIINTRIG